MKTIFSWIAYRFPLLKTWKSYFSSYYVPKNFNFLYVFGSLALILLVNQFVSGFWLTLFYTPTVEQAFSSIQYIMRDVSWGWLLRYLHSTGASAFFIVLYLHLFRGLLYGSYQRPRELVWLLGMLLYVLMLAAAFFGYLLPWGQMSYWGAEVITSLVEAIPYVGKSIMIWLRGDYTVSNVTLARFFALHVIAVPLLLLAFVFLHIVALHQVGSNNPEGIDIKAHLNERGKPLDGVPLHPYYTIKDALAVVGFLIVFFAVICFAPDLGGYFLEGNNFAPANFLVTPDEITPMWYMAPFYAILRAIPNKSGGVLLMFLAMVILFILPWLDKSPVRSMRYKGKASRWMLAAAVFAFVLLGYLGTVSVTPVRLGLARMSLLIYFAYFILMPIYTRLESVREVPQRIRLKK